MSIVKTQVEAYIKQDRTLIGGRNLYNKMPNKSMAFQNNMTRFTNTPENIAKVCYALCQLAGIPERNYNIMMQKPVAKAKAKETVVVDNTPVLTANDHLIAFNSDTANYAASKKLVKALELKSPSQKKVDIFATLTEARAEAVKKK